MSQLRHFDAKRYLVPIILGFLLLARVAPGQTTGKIAGTVTDAETGNPLPGVNILLEGTEQGAATDESGDYFIIRIQPGVYSVTASMIGYQAVTKTDVRVSVDHTTRIDFALQTSVIAGQAITIEAEREVISMDKSSSIEVTTPDEIDQIPLATDINEVISLQAGMDGLSVRGGSLDQTQFMVDGLIMVDNRANEPLTQVNLSSVQEISVIKGGFNAEYGNVRSGLINVVTKEGNASRYTGSVDFQYAPPHYKHLGPSLFSPDNYYLKPYLDPAVMWEGTNNGAWDEEMQNSYPSFAGWNSVAEDRAQTPEEARDQFLWLHRADGADQLAPAGYDGSPRAGQYGNQPDWQIDASFGGPVPVVSKAMGDLRFFASHRTNWEAFGLPVVRDYYKESNSLLKLTSNVTPSMKLSLEGNYGEVNSVSRAVDSPNGNNDFVRSGEDIFNADIATGLAYDHRAGANLYWPESLAPFDIYRTMQGISLDHTLSSNTFYSLRITHIGVQNSARGPASWRDTSAVRSFGGLTVDESPYGFWWEGGYQEMTDGMLYAAIGAGVRDTSQVNTLNVKFDLTSQINKYSQIKIGLLYNYDDLNTHYGKVSQYTAGGDNWQSEWRYYPSRIGAYVQNKLEFEGMIANFGVRLDYNQPNTDWYTADRYSQYFRKPYKDVFTEVAPKEETKSQLAISPRLGISHPIGANSKLYFNYGHFYSMPRSEDMYGIGYGSQAAGIDFLGNPSAEMPKTIAYELGFEQSIADVFLVHASGYYKDVTRQTGEVAYTNYDGSVDYATIENNNYEDIRGFEFRLEKRYGQWISGWVNYNYMVSTAGYIGREHYFQDPARQQLEGLQNPYMEIPLARPIARANFRFHIPANWGPSVGGIKPMSNLNLSLLFYWRAGRYQTWDPLETYKLQDNLHWAPQYSFDARLSKRFEFRSTDVTLYMDIRNLFNNKYISSQGFADGQDSRAYLESLHLPLYAGEDYQAAGYTPGNDRPGDMRSKDKSYIDMPNRQFLTFLNPRTFIFGLRLNL